MSLKYVGCVARGVCSKRQAYNASLVDTDQEGTTFDRQNHKFETEQMHKADSHINSAVAANCVRDCSVRLQEHLSQGCVQILQS